MRIVGPQVLGRLHLGGGRRVGRTVASGSADPADRPGAILLAFTAGGKVALLRWEFAGQTPGGLEKFLPDSLTGERVVQVLPLPSEGSLGLLSTDGRFKRLSIDEFQELSGRAASVLKLKDGVRLLRVVICRQDREVVVASSTGRMLRLAVNEANLPLMGRAAQGPLLLRLLPGERWWAPPPWPPAGTCCWPAVVGQLKRLAVENLRPCQRGDLGQIAIRFRDRQDALVDLCGAETAWCSVVISEVRSVRLATADLERQDSSGDGELLGLGARETVQALVPLITG